MPYGKIWEPKIQDQQVQTIQLTRTKQICDFYSQVPINFFWTRRGQRKWI